jgi:hypothetical protein
MGVRLCVCDRSPPNSATAGLVHSVGREILDHYETNQSPPRGPELRLRTQERYQCKSSLSTAVPHSITSAAVATSCARHGRPPDSYAAGCGWGACADLNLITHSISKRRCGTLVWDEHYVDAGVRPKIFKSKMR